MKPIYYRDRIKYEEYEVSIHTSTVVQVGAIKPLVLIIIIEQEYVL